MAGLKGRIKGSSLIEVLVSLTILSLLWILLLGSFRMFEGNASPAYWFTSNLILRNQLEQIEQINLGENQENEIEGRIVRIKWNWYDKEESLIRVSVSIIQSNGQGLTRNKIMYQPNEP